VLIERRIDVEFASLLPANSKIPLVRLWSISSRIGIFSFPMPLDAIYARASFIIPVMALRSRQSFSEQLIPQGSEQIRVLNPSNGREMCDFFGLSRYF
jgi:hypothetical protein